jgi:hypothetical protein
LGTADEILAYDFLNFVANDGIFQSRSQCEAIVFRKKYIEFRVWKITVWDLYQESGLVRISNVLSRVRSTEMEIHGFPNMISGDFPLI